MDVNKTIRISNDIAGNNISAEELAQYGTGKEGWENFKQKFNEINNEVKNQYKKMITTTPKPPKEILNELKEDAINYEKENGLNHVKLDANFGKFDKSKLEKQAKAEEIIGNYLEERNKKIIVRKFMAPNFIDRSSVEIVNSFAPKNENELLDFYSIIGHKGNNDIEPISGKKYGELKAKLINDGLSKINSVAKEYGKIKDEKDMFEFYKNNYAYLLAGFEMDGGKIENMVKNVGLSLETLDKDYPELSQTLKQMLPVKDYYNSFGTFTNELAIMSNPLYPYASNEDLAYLSTLLYDTTSKYKSENILDMTPNCVQDIYNGLSAHDYSKVINNCGDMNMLDGSIASNISILIAQGTNTKVEDMKFFDGEKEIKLKDASKTSLEQIGNLVKKGSEIKITDKNGKFLFNYKSDAEHLGFPQGGELGLDFRKTLSNAYTNAINETTVKIGDYKSDVEVALSNMKQDIKAESEKVNEKVSKAIEKEIDDKVSKMAKLLDKMGPEKGRSKDESYYYDIKDMFSDILGKKDKSGNEISFNKDKDAYIHGLKSIRTFCQAYLDEKTGTKMDKTEKAKYEAINTVYTSLMDVENQLTEVKNLEEKMPENLTLKVRNDNPEFVKAVENKEIERPRLFEELSKKEQEDVLKEKGIIQEEKKVNAPIKEESKELSKEKEIENVQEIGK